MDTIEEKGRVFRDGKWLLIGYALASLVGVIASIPERTSLRNMDGWDIVLPSIWILMFFFQLVYYINKKITLYSDRLVYRTAFRDICEVPYSKIERYKRKRWGIYIFSDKGEHRFRFDRKADADEIERILAPHVQNNETHNRD